MRIMADDPLAVIQKGVNDLRQVERQKRVWMEEQKREIKELEKAERQRAREERGGSGGDILEGFSLGEPKIRGSQKRKKHGHGGSGHRHRRQSRTRHSDRSKEERHYQKDSDKRKEVRGWEVGPGGRYSSQFAEIHN